ncbi:MAG: ATP-binding protein [Elainellaceae cyanobacterium]
MGGTMQILESVFSCQQLSARQFSQFQITLEQVAHEQGALLFTQHSLPASTLPEAEAFILVVSPHFSTLLLSQPCFDGANRPTSSQAAGPIGHQVRLTFDPDAIVAFIDYLFECIDRALPLVDTLQQARAAVQPNNAAVQSEFTLRLVSQLTEASPAAAPAVCHLRSKEELLQQQVAQEQLFNQVTTQIRQSLELPVILQTAVEQVRQVLQVDRLVIYRLDLPKSAHSNTLSQGLLTESNEADHSGSVIYEARAVDTIPSVLNLSDAHCFTQASRHNELREDLAIAVEDVEVQYAHAPCLLDFLQRAKVRAKLVAPILIRNRLWGLLIAHQCFAPRQWQESEHRFLTQISEYLAIAISQAQLYIELQQQKRTLERRVAERTQELQDVMQSAQAANRAKSEFLAAVSHELRTPLTCIIGMSATLQRWTNEVLSERQRHFLQTIHDSGEYLLALINDILDLSQVEAGKLLLNISEFSLSRLSQQALKTFEGQASLSEVALELDLRVAPQRDRFVADPRRVQQILYNLLDNAIKFTPAGGQVTLRVFSEENIAVFQVKDCGIGIPEDQLPLLFQKFRQLNAGYQRQYRGTGLGLALTEQLVELHGGWITVESTVGVGSVFTVRLPMQQPNTNGTLVKARSATVSSAIKGRIVLIEHQEENANLICDILTAAGYQIVWMLEGSTAVNQIEVLQPIVVITNIQLPDIDGYNLIHGIRQNPATKHLKVIALTPAAVNGKLSAWKMAGADDYLVQPLRPDILLQKIMILTEAN